MLFNFEERYRDYTNAALLNITLQPDKYQAEAVAAAKKLLEQRTVTENDHQEASQVLEEQTLAGQQKVRQQQVLKEKTEDLLEPILQPQAMVQPEKWLRLFLIGLALQYVWTLYDTAKSVIDMIQYGGLPYWSWADLKYFDLLWLPFTFYLLYHRRKWGWILTFASSLFIFISKIFNFPALLVYLRVNPDADITFFFIGVLIQCGICLFLWRRDIASLFGISDALRKKVLLIVSVGSALLLAGLMLWVRFL